METTGSFRLTCTLLASILFWSWSLGQHSDVELKKAALDKAIKESAALEAAQLFETLRVAGVDLKTLPVTDVADLAVSRLSNAYQWESIASQDLVRLCRPFEGLVDTSWRGRLLRAGHFWGLMASGERARALDLWKKLEKSLDSLLSLPYVINVSNLPRGDLATLQSFRWALWFSVLGYVSSASETDRQKGVQLARRNLDWVTAGYREEIMSIQVAFPAAQRQILRVLSNQAIALLQYTLYEAGLWKDLTANMFLREESQTNIRFQRLEKTGLEECAPQAQLNTVIVLGDFDDDSYLDVLIPGQGLWQNLGGTRSFKRIDTGLGANIDGPFGALADINNDNLVDIVIVGPRTFAVSLQTKERRFTQLTSASDSLPENPGGIGLFDGDADGFLDIFISGYEKPGVESTRALVLRNKGDGTFHDVTGIWGFSDKDITLCGRGVSPCDYDDDGLTDLYVSNYRLNRNTLWHNVSSKGKTAFSQCASAPWFGGEKRNEDTLSIDRGIEGQRGSFQGKIYWGNSIGSAWGDINGDGTPDLLCTNVAHPRNIRRGISDISRVYLNSGANFKDHTAEAGLTFAETNASPLLADFNNDGSLDLSVTNMYRIDVNQLFEGIGDGSFREVTFRAGALAANSLGQAAGDFDNDGDLDLFLLDGNHGLLLYENTLVDSKVTPANANWIELKLLGGKRTNGSAFGTRVTVQAGGKRYVREIAGLRGFSNCDDPVVHVGLGSYKGTVDLEIRWTPDSVQRIKGLTTGQRHVLREVDYED